MGRYSGTLANLMEEAIGAGKSSSSKKNSSGSSSKSQSHNLWAKVLNYLENHSTTDGAIERQEFESPLPPFSVPSEILDEQLLERKYGLRQDNTILKLAVTAAPAPVVAALCHLQPHAARIPDHRGKLPLHVACRRNPNDPDTLIIFEILLAVYFEALAHRDSAGRTPLHCLFMYHHAPHRSVSLVKAFCQELSPKLIETLKQPQPHHSHSTGMPTTPRAGGAMPPTPTTLATSSTFGNLGVGSGLPSPSGKDHHHQHDEDLDDYPLPEVPRPSTRDKVPSNAAIIPDARHGALPLHYAVMEGASRDVLRYLLQVYPESKRLVDRKGRTALAWYLGAGHIPSGFSAASNSGSLATKLLVTGEPTDPHSVSWWDKNKIESATVQLLLNSRSARMADCTGRSPLHWAICTFARHTYFQQHPELQQQGPSVSMKTIQLLLDHYTEGLITGDINEKTPLHLLFDAVKEIQEQEWKRLLRNKAERNDLDLKQGGRKPVSLAAAVARNKRESPSSASAHSNSPTGNFAPPMELLELLVTSGGMASSTGEPTTPTGVLDDRSAVFMEDKDGRLPIHAAVGVASCAEVVMLLIKAHPTSLVHTTEETLKAPLHAAVSSPYVAPLQTPETMRLIIRAYVASRHGTYVDGRLALKMEDADGNYPIHLACKNQACLEVLQMFVEEYPKCALFQTPEGDLPLHALTDKHVFDEAPDGIPPLGASLASTTTWSSAKEEEIHHEKLSVLQQKIRLLVDPILASGQCKELLQTPSFDHGMLPLHIVVAWGAVSYTTVKRMLDKCPAAAKQWTTVKGHEFTPLYLHENFKSKVLRAEMSSQMDQEWQYIRELLFSYAPLEKGHRHLQDILMQSVRVVRSEVGGHSSTANELEESFHWRIQQELKKIPQVPTIDMADTFSSIEVPDIDHGGRPLSKRAIERSRQNTMTPKNKKKKSKGKDKKSSSNKSKNDKIVHSHSNNSATTKKSIYDDDALNTGYVVSDSEHEDNDELEDDYFSGPESVEEYFSDESDERFNSFDDEEENGDPTATTATGSCDDTSAAPDSSKQEGRLTSVQEGSKDDSKKDDDEDDNNDAAEATDKVSAMRSCGPKFSEVGMRLLTFLMLFCDEKNPSDNYANLLEGIFDEVSRALVDQVVSMPLPSYAADYMEENARLTGLTLRDVSSPKCRELIHKLFYFLGRFDFTSETGGILLNRTSDSAMVQIRSTEWTFSTEEYNEAPEIEPGVAEAQVWETGIIPTEEVGYMGATFKAMRRSICFLFTKNAQAYYNEVNCRSELGVAVEGGSFSGSHIVPLIAHYDATSLDHKKDRMYKNDTNNESFATLDIFGKSNVSTGESICLTDYPYALVFPYSNYGDLFDYFFRHGVDGLDDTREICAQIGKSLSSMHEKGIIHGNVAMRNIVLFPPVDDAEFEEGRKHWALTNLSGAYRLEDQNSYIGKVSAQGMAEFSSSSLPPEMFVKLDQEQLKEYKLYWDTVEKEFGVSVDRNVVDPVIDFQTGASYVMRCHYVPSEERADDVDKLPALPYKLLPARESADIWAFGQLLFMLCSSGRPLFPTNARTGSLLNYKEICEWKMEEAEALVYEHVDNPLAQDVLLRLLSPYEKRCSMSMEKLLNHPFFNDGEMTSSGTRAVATKRKNASLAFRRWLELSVTEKSDEGWLKDRTINVASWDFDFQTRLHLTPTALVPNFLSRKTDHIGMPCSFVILPYKLVRNKKGVLTPPSKRDVERAERLGLRMLALSKACHFVNAMKKAVGSTDAPSKWSSTALLEAMDLPKEEFSNLQTTLAQLASEHVEQFRADPVRIGLKLIHAKAKEFLACYEDTSKVLLYLVDEYKGVPVVSPSSDPYPHLVEPSMTSEVAKRGLPFMYLCARYFRSVSGGVPGFVRLIFEAAAPHVPPSWQPVCKGLDCSLDHQAIVDDMTVLCEALHASPSDSSIDDDFEFMQKFLAEIDPRRTYANLQRVSSGEASVWTSSASVNEIQATTKNCGFKEAMEKKKEADRKMSEQEARIKELEAELEKMKFRTALKLQVPEEANSPSITAAVRSPISPIQSASKFASNLFVQEANKIRAEHYGQYMETNADVIVSSAEAPVETNSVIETKEEDDTSLPTDKQAQAETSPTKAAVNDYYPTQGVPNIVEGEEHALESHVALQATEQEPAEPSAAPAVEPSQNTPVSPRKETTAQPNYQKEEERSVKYQFVAEETALEADESLLESLSFECFDTKQRGKPQASPSQDESETEETVTDYDKELESIVHGHAPAPPIPVKRQEKPKVHSPKAMTQSQQGKQSQPKVAGPQLSCYTDFPSGGTDEVRTLLDDMFAEADLVFNSTPLRAVPKTPKTPTRVPLPESPVKMSSRSTKMTPRSPTASETEAVYSSGTLSGTPKSSRSFFGREETTSTASTAPIRERRHDSSTITTDPAKTGAEDSSDFIEITQQQLSELKQKVISTRSPPTSPRPTSPRTEPESFSHLIPNSFQSDESVARETLAKNNLNRVLSPRSTSREPSEIGSSSAGNNRSIEAGSVKRLSNFFLSNQSTEKPGPGSENQPKLSSPQARARKAALENSPEEDTIEWNLS